MPSLLAHGLSSGAQLDSYSQAMRVSCYTGDCFQRPAVSGHLGNPEAEVAMCLAHESAHVPFPFVSESRWTRYTTCVPS